jgi:D-amino peptidase
MLMGHHAREGTEGAFLPHTISSREYEDIKINDLSVGEIGIESCYAGHWDVPFALVQADASGCAETREQFPWVVTAEVKRALTRDQCEGPDPEPARRLTAAKVVEAIGLGRAGRPKPYKPAMPMTMTVRFRTIEQADEVVKKAGAMKTSARKLDAVTVEARVERQCDVIMWLRGTGLNMEVQYQ